MYVYTYIVKGSIMQPEINNNLLNTHISVGYNNYVFTMPVIASIFKQHTMINLKL